MARTIARMGLFFLVVTACIAASAHLGAGQSAPSPAADCTSVLTELLPCLDFLTNNSVNSVAPACCSALSNVSSSSPLCLCQFISQYYNQSTQLGINATRALQLPGLCNLNVGTGNCSAILGPSAAPAPAPLVLDPAFAPAPISIVPAPVFSPLASLTPVPAPDAETPVSTPESSASPRPSVDCTSEVGSLSGCLTFLTGSASTPSSSCCTNLGSVVTTAPECLCSLAESSGGALSSINATLVQELPTLCSVSASLSDCAGVGAPSTIPIGSEGPGGSPSGNHGSKSAASSSLYMVIALSVVALAHALVQ